jgi:6-phosphogluconolactonase
VTTATGRLLLLGGYTPPAGDGQGIRLVEHRFAQAELLDRGVLAVTESPSFVVAAADGSRVYAVNELAAGRVTAFRRTGSATEPELTELQSQSTGGDHPCHLALRPDGRLLAVANYTSGTVSIHPLDDDGAVLPLVQLLRLHGSGPDTDRQDGPHAHQVTFLAGGAELAVADLGSDRVWRYRHDSTSYQPIEALELPAGSGTRQLLLDPAAERGYVLGELDNSLSSASWGVRPRLLASVAGHAQPVEAGTLSAALIEGPGPGLLYASHRGADRVSVIRVTGERAEAVADFAAHGRGPRHLCLVGNDLYVANELSGTLACLPVGPDGLPAGAVSLLSVPSPTCVLGW